MNQVLDKPPTVGRRKRRILVCGFALLMLVGAGLFVRYFPWVPFHPVCVANYDERGPWGRIFWGGFIRLRGELRRDFRRVAAGSFYPRLVTSNGLYVTVDVYLDPDFYRDYTTKVVGSLVHKEVNPGRYDGFGRRLLAHESNGNIDAVIYMPRRNKLRECEFTRFFAIDGAPPPVKIRQAFEETRFDHSEEFIDQGVRIMEHFIAKYATD